MLMLDTQVYSNTGGQASTASFTGQNTKMSVHGNVFGGKQERRKEIERGPVTASYGADVDRVIGVLMPLDYPPEPPVTPPQPQRVDPAPAPALRPPERPSPSQKPAAWPPEGEVPVEEALAGAHGKGLLLDMDLTAFHAILRELHARPMTRVDRPPAGDCRLVPAPVE